MGFDEKYMMRAIELAKLGEGAVNPNPLVGAVIVKDGRIIGEGYHARYGDLHAERSAIANLSESAEGASIYVTLEPCCHFGKQPPCTHAIVENKIKTVYVGSDDPNAMVAGKGIQYLRDNGVEVITGVLKEECDKLNDVFFHYITKKTPYVCLKYAMTLDGKIATWAGESKWISNEASRKKVAFMRNKYMGIMVGIGTVIKDNPLLTARICDGRNPIRIICDTNLRIPLESQIVKTAKDVPTIVAMGEPDNNSNNAESLYDELAEKKMTLDKMGVRIISVAQKDGKLDLNELMIKLGEEGIDGILLEGGGTLNYNAVSAGVVNEICAFVAPKIFGGRDALSPVEGEGVRFPDEAACFKLDSVTRIEDDVLLRYVTNKVR